MPAGACGTIVHAPITGPSNHRSREHFNDWLKRRGIIGLSGIDTRALTTFIREKGMPNAVIAHAPDGKFDVARLKAKAAAWPGLVGMDLVPQASAPERREWEGTTWLPEIGYGQRSHNKFRVVAVDYGIKSNIFAAACRRRPAP